MIWGYLVLEIIWPKCYPVTVNKKTKTSCFWRYFRFNLQQRSHPLQAIHAKTLLIKRIEQYRCSRMIVFTLCMNVFNQLECHSCVAGMNLHFVHYTWNIFQESVCHVVCVNPDAPTHGPQCAKEHLVVYFTFIVCEAFICTKITAYEGNLALSLKRHKRFRT